MFARSCVQQRSGEGLGFIYIDIFLISGECVVIIQGLLAHLNFCSWIGVLSRARQEWLFVRFK